MTLSFTSIISERRVATLNRLVALASDKAEAEKLVSELEQMDKLLQQSRPQGDVLRFARYMRPIEAVVAYLEERKRPADENAIIEAVLAGGFRGGGREQALNVHKGIFIFLTGTGKKLNKIKEVNGLIGLYDWPDDMFS